MSDIIDTAELETAIDDVHKLIQYDVAGEYDETSFERELQTLLRKIYSLGVNHTIKAIFYDDEGISMTTEKIDQFRAAYQRSLS